MQSTDSPNHLSHHLLRAESIDSFYFDEQMSFYENGNQEPTTGAGILQAENFTSPKDYSRKRSNTTDASNVRKKSKTATHESTRDASLEADINDLLPDTGSGFEEWAADESKTPEIVNFGTTVPVDAHASQHTGAMPLIPIVS